MSPEYIGYLSKHDPLFEYIREHIGPQLGVDPKRAVYRVSQFSHAQSVYLYEEKYSGAAFIGKFHKPAKHPSWELNPAENEYRNLVYLRGLGFDAPPHLVVRPLGCAPECNNFLATELVRGESLDSLLLAAIPQPNPKRFHRKLGALAHFLAALHNRTAAERSVDFQLVLNYYERVLLTLQSKRGLSDGLAARLRALAASWKARACMWEDRSALVHGDATPPNFFFGSGPDVIAIDLERMQWSDRLFDVGRFCGELKHFYFRGTGDPMAGETCIGIFLKEYSRHFPDQKSAFAAISQRAPFYIGLTLLRIARNWWVDAHYRAKLIHEALNNLEALP